METCEECGNPEKSKYTCTPDRTFTCSTCVMQELMEHKKEEVDIEEPKKTL